MIVGMKRTLGLAALLSVLLSGNPAPSPAGPPPPQATCVFTNPGFSGKCTENADIAEGSSAAQSCGAILQCLNDVDCLKTYCSATQIRSGWKLESAK